MYNYNFLELATGRMFAIKADSDYEMKSMLTKCRYSKKIRFCGKTRRY